jgi:ABC-type nitrate/sulfonate/bicarbonate transport system substrate-binding protein
MPDLTRRDAIFAAAAAAAAFGGMPARAAAAPARLALQALWLNDPEFLGYMLAIDKGFYAERGLSVEYLPGGPNVVPEGALLTGKADIAITQMVSTGTAIVQKGAPLKIIGAQYQKSPQGVVSMSSSVIAGPQDLIGRTIAVPTLSMRTFMGFAKLHGLTDKVRVVPYTFDPTPLINGQIDATFEFVTQVPYIIEQRTGRKADSFLIHDHGLPLFIGLLTVSEDTLANKRRELVEFIRASRRGWAENFADPVKYPREFLATWLKGTGSPIGALEYFNGLQPSLMDSPAGLFSISEVAVAANVEALERLDIRASASIFDRSLLAEASE